MENNLGELNEQLLIWLDRTHGKGWAIVKIASVRIDNTNQQEYLHWRCRLYGWQSASRYDVWGGRSGGEEIACS